MLQISNKPIKGFIVYRNNDYSSSFTPTKIPPIGSEIKTNGEIEEEKNKTLLKYGMHVFTRVEDILNHFIYMHLDCQTLDYFIRSMTRRHRIHYEWERKLRRYKILQVEVNVSNIKGAGLVTEWVRISVVPILSLVLYTNKVTTISKTPVSLQRYATALSKSQGVTNVNQEDNEEN